MTEPVGEILYDFFLNNAEGELQEQRMKDKFLMKTSSTLLYIIGTYLLIIYFIGPYLMSKRKAFEIKKVIIVYNLIQLLWNGYLFLRMIPAYRNANIICTDYDNSNSEANLLELHLHYSYTLLKFFDLIETIFYVLRKKNRQISFLHVYHHTGILICTWISCRYLPGGHSVFVAFYNTFVHFIMYLYYLNTSLRSTATTVWWKKYLTLLQIIQHCLIFISLIIPLLNPYCNFCKGGLFLFAISVLSIIYLFVKFYYETYVKPEAQKE